jgi:hypothetical protein
MKLKIFFSITFLFLFSQLTFSQNDFGAIGSYWQYGYAPHNGDGFGWTKIEIVDDILIDGEIHKVINQTSFHQPIASPSYQYSQILNQTMQIKNDSVYFGGVLILDFDMNLTDSLFIEGFGWPASLKLAVDSITTEEVNGFSYKKWYGQKLCLADPDNPYPYEPFVILEGVGQVQQDFLFWNIDNCIIGGGHYYFWCYRNEDFTYPPSDECVPLMLTNTDELEKNSKLKIFPNPTQDFLNIKSEQSKILEIVIYNSEGKEIYQNVFNDFTTTIFLSSFENGIYMIKVRTEKEIMIDRIIKVD